eukprot:6067238-Pyramimonas_sp.AAC.1
MNGLPRRTTYADCSRPAPPAPAAPAALEFHRVRVLFDKIVSLELSIGHLAGCHCAELFGHRP